MTRLAGKVAICTGSGRPQGLGAAILKRLAADGCRVVVTDIGSRDSEAANLASSDDMNAVVAALDAAGHEAIAVPCDVSDETAIRELVAATVKRFGRLDIMVNNAAIGFVMQPLNELTTDDWRRVIDVNLTGAFLGTREAAAQMERQGDGGRIINVASQAAKSGFRHMSPYVSSKHGLIGLTRSSAIDLAGFGITVNAVCPNHVTTGLGKTQNEYFAALRGQTVEEYRAGIKQRIPLGRVGLPDDTAAVTAFLASDDAAYITGEAINVSGGEEMH
ncbi:MAG: SDR family NAD(P)-dependent oxidoreductase [Pseudomonadota bacterium]